MSHMELENWQDDAISVLDQLKHKAQRISAKNEIVWDSMKYAFLQVLFFPLQFHLRFVPLKKVQKKYYLTF